MLETLLDGLLDTAKTLPFLFAAYILIGLIETKASAKMQGKLSGLGPLGPIGGAILGIIPQCGLSVAAANFFSSGIITFGTVIAVFISTSDEFIPILISHPSAIGYLWKMIVVKLIIAIITGLLVDLGVRIYFKRIMKKIDSGENTPDEELPPCGDPNCDGSCSVESPGCSDENCGCANTKYNFFVAAIIRTIQTGLFILAVNLVLGYAVYFIGEDTIGSIMLNGTILQPFIAALIGFIPNCAASVILTELFAQGALSFGSCVAGLCTGAGVGLAVLFKNNRRIKENLFIMAVLYVVAVGSGLIIDLFIH